MCMYLGGMDLELAMAADYPTTDRAPSLVLFVVGAE